MGSVKELKNALLPSYEIESPDGNHWLYFNYEDGNGRTPWKYPKLVEYKGKVFKWMSYNSDNSHVVYKSIPKEDLAFVRKKA
jgi:hypothetical protein